MKAIKNIAVAAEDPDDKLRDRMYDDIDTVGTILLRLGRFGQEAGVGQYTVTEKADYFLQ